MITTIKDKVQLLFKEIELIEQSDQPNIFKYTSIVTLSRETIIELQTLFAKADSRSKVDEIEYFKHIQPSAIQCCIYYSLLCRYEVSRTSLCLEKDNKYLCKTLLGQIRKYYQEHGEIISYYKLGSTHLDESYFIRNAHPMPFLLEECLAYINQKFTTGFDIILGRYLALERFKTYLENELHSFDHHDTIHNLITSCENDKRLPWYDQKVDIVELAYALYYACFKDRNNVNLEDVLHVLSTAFNVKIEDASRKFIDIKNRSNPTKFIDSLRKSLISEIEKDLE